MKQLYLLVTVASRSLFFMTVCGRMTRRCGEKETMGFQRQLLTFYVYLYSRYSVFLLFHLPLFYSEVMIAVYIAPVLGSTTNIACSVCTVCLSLLYEACTDWLLYMHSETCLQVRTDGWKIP